MTLSSRNTIYFFAASLLLGSWACQLPSRILNRQAQPTNPPLASQSVPETSLPPATSTPTQTASPVETATVSATLAPTEVIPTATSTVSHVLVPPASIKPGDPVHDVVSVDTAAEQRAPYGDRYDSNLLERPFLQDMSYIADLDIKNFSLSKDEQFYYVSIALVGANPNNNLGIQYGVELDLDADGFGDFIVLARPPHSVEWSTDNVQVVSDLDHDTGGLSSALSDGPLPGTGYEMVIFDGGRGPDDDPDLAWVRVNAGKDATVQFAFKRALAGNRFMFGVIADAGLKDITKLDYVDRFAEEKAGSPVRGDENYPLKALFGVDNTCRKIQGFMPTGVEPQSCPEK
jgi:hypothetical protein